MSVSSVLSEVENDLSKFATAVANDWKKVKAGWALISSPQVRAVALTLTKDIVQTVNDSETAIVGKGLNFTIDSTVVADIKTLIADAKAGEGVIASDLKALGIIFSSASTATSVTTTVISNTNAASA